MRFDIMTLFPDMVDRVLSESIIGRARKNGLFELGISYIRDYAVNDYGRVDDTPYGGGRGMLMMAPPIYDCYAAIQKAHPFAPEKTRVIYLSPKGRHFNEDRAMALTTYEHIILLCGHYEGIDQRVLDEIVDEEISIGDFVLTGGELAACMVVDAVCRLLPGVLPDPVCYEDESISSGLLEYPQYTRPHSFHGQSVPEVLLSGHHENIAKWRQQKSLELTEALRPDLLQRMNDNTSSNVGDDTSDIDHNRIKKE